ncbi:hypothetical protein GQ457_01G006780 [Hibiscus cannabinus]
MSSSTYSDTANIVGRWRESLDNSSEDEENIVPMMKDDDVHLLNDDDVEIVMTYVTKENGLELKMMFEARLLLGLCWKMSNMFGVMLDQKPSNYYPFIQFINLRPTCKTWTILQWEIRNMKLAYLVLHQLPTMRIGTEGLIQNQKKKLGFKEYCIKQHMRPCVAKSNTKTYCNFIQTEESDVGGCELIQPKFNERIRKLRRHGEHVFNSTNDFPGKDCHKLMMKVSVMAI